MAPLEQEGAARGEGAPAPEAGTVCHGSSWKLRAEGLRGSLVLFQGKLKTYGGALRGTWHEEEHHLLPSPVKASPATTEGLPPASSGTSLPHVCTRDSFPYRCQPFLPRLPGADCHSTHDVCFSCFPPVQSSVYTSGACSSSTFPVPPSHAAFTHPARKVHKAHSWFFSVSGSFLTFSLPGVSLPLLPGEDLSPPFTCKPPLKYFLKKT